MKNNNKQLKKLLLEHKKLTKRKVTLKLTCVLDLAWRSAESYDVDGIEQFGMERAIKKYEKELKDFCRRADAYGKKHHKDKDWIWVNHFWL